MKNPIITVRDQLQKFTGFTYPSNIRGIANESVRAINRKEIPFPLSTCESSLITVMTAILSNTKYTQNCPSLILSIIDCFGDGLFVGTACDQLTTGLVNASLNHNQDWAFSYLQECSTYVVKYCFNLNVLRAVFSILFSLMSHKDVMISTSSFAILPQTLEVFVDALNKTEPPKGFDCGKYQIQKPQDLVLYLLFNDLCCIALRQPTQWLVLTQAPTLVIYDILAFVVDGYSKLLEDVSVLLFLFEGAVIQAINDQLGVEFVVSFISRFLPSHVSLCQSVFTDYLSRVSGKSRHVHVPLFFFRGIVMKSEDFAAQVYMLCDDNALFTQLIAALVAFIEPNAPSTPISFSLAPTKFAGLSTEKGRNGFILSSPYEIVFGILRAFEKNTDIKMKRFIVESNANLSKLLNSGLTLSSEISFSMVCDAVASLLRLSNTLGINDMQFSSFCAMDLHGTMVWDTEALFSRRTDVYVQFLLSFAAKEPEMLKGCWQSLWAAVFKSHVAAPSCFAEDLADEQLEEASKALLSVRPLNGDFACSFVVVSQSRFELVWKAFRPIFLAALDESVIDPSLFNLFLLLIRKGISEVSEEAILEMAMRFVLPGSPLKFEEKTKVLEHIRQLLAENVAVIRKGWTFLFQILSPVNYNDDSGILQTSFRILNLICNDHFYLVPQSSLPACMELIFRFAQYDVDLNVSLSSFDLLWIAVRVMETNSENWSYLINQLLQCIQDPRNDVSVCAINTILTLLSTNFEQIPSDVLEFLVREGFPSLLTNFSQSKHPNYASWETTLQELAQYTASFWQAFNGLEMFRSSFLPLLIESQTKFTLACDDYELITRGFEFYECLFQCAALDEQAENGLRDSINTISDRFMKIDDPSSIIFTCFGRLMGKILQSLKTRNVQDSIVSWLPILEKLVKVCKSVDFVHITVQTALNTIPELFPLSEHATLEVVSWFLKCAESEENPALAGFISSLLSTIFTGNLQQELRAKFVLASKSFFKRSISESFMKVVLDADIDCNDLEQDEMLDCYMQMEETCPSLGKKANGILARWIDRMKKEQQLAFVERNKDDFKILSLMWTIFFYAASEKFNQDLYDTCFPFVIEDIANICNRASQLQILEILNFLPQYSVPPKTQGGSGQWFLVKMMPSLAKLITHNDPVVREKVQTLMLIISDIISTLY